MHYVYLSIAIVAEVIATTSLKAAEGFTKPLPVVAVVIGYAISFYFLALVVQKIPLAVAYTIWGGAGVALVTVAGAVFFRQIPDLPALIGMGLVVAGITVIQLFSKTMAH